MEESHEDNGLKTPPAPPLTTCHLPLTLAFLRQKCEEEVWCCWKRQNAFCQHAHSHTCQKMIQTQHRMRGPHAATYVSSHCCIRVLIRVLIQLQTCPHTAAYMPSHCYILVLTLLHTCPHTATYVSSGRRGGGHRGGGVTTLISTSAYIPGWQQGGRGGGRLGQSSVGGAEVGRRRG